MKERWNPQEVLVVSVGLMLGVGFLGMIGTILFGLLFTTQPLNKQAPNDVEAWKVINSTVPYIVGALSGLVAANGIKRPKKPEEQS